MLDSLPNFEKLVSSVLAEDLSSNAHNMLAPNYLALLLHSFSSSEMKKLLVFAAIRSIFLKKSHSCQISLPQLQKILQKYQSSRDGFDLIHFELAIAQCDPNIICALNCDPKITLLKLKDLYSLSCVYNVQTYNFLMNYLSCNPLKLDDKSDNHEMIDNLFMGLLQEESVAHLAFKSLQILLPSLAFQYSSLPSVLALLRFKLEYKVNVTNILKEILDGNISLLLQLSEIADYKSLLCNDSSKEALKEVLITDEGFNFSESLNSYFFHQFISKYPISVSIVDNELATLKNGGRMKLISSVFVEESCHLESLEYLCRDFRFKDTVSQILIELLCFAKSKIFNYNNLFMKRLLRCISMVIYCLKIDLSHLYVIFFFL